MRIYFLVGLVFLFFSCSKKEEKTIEYNYFVTDISNNNLVEKKDILYKALLQGDSLFIYKRNNGIRNSFKFNLNSKGIYVVDKEKKYMLYPFEMNHKLVRDNVLTSNFHDVVELRGKKKYVINGIEYKLYHFFEETYDQNLDSYYLEGEGFICFYEFKGSEFLYLDSPKALEVYKIFSKDYSFNVVLKAEKMKEDLLRDSMYFSNN